VNVRPQHTLVPTERPSRCRFAPRWVSVLSCLCVSCLPPKAERLNCDDLLEPAQVQYSTLQAQISGQGEKGCAFPACHGAEVANHGIRFDDAGSTYDALTSRIDDIYGQLAAGTMPRGATRWEASDLQLLRSWYCYGSFPAP